MAEDIAAKVAARAEATRIAEHQDALESLRQFGKPLAPPDPVIVIDMRLASLAGTYQRDWQEFHAEATAALMASAARLNTAREGEL